MATGMRHTLPQPRHHNALNALPGVLLAILILSATAAAVVYIGTQKTSVTSSLDSGVPADLIAVRDSMPRFEGMTDYQTAVYSDGANNMDAVYYSNENPEAVVTFYEQQLVKAGWKTVDAPHITVGSANPDRTVNTGWEYKATKDGHAVTVTAVEAGADVTQGDTQHTVHIERTS